MMSDRDDEIAAAKKRGYSRGYAAGKRRRHSEIDSERRRREQQAFLDRVFIAMLPAAMAAQGWKIGDAPVTSSEDRIKLARIWAEKALKQRPFA